MVRESRPELRALGIARLKSRAMEQHRRVDAERLRVATRALRGQASGKSDFSPRSPPLP